jgi:hypothetical protein
MNSPLFDRKACVFSWPNAFLQFASISRGFSHLTALSCTAPWLCPRLARPDQGQMAWMPGWQISQSRAKTGTGAWSTRGRPGPAQGSGGKFFGSPRPRSPVFRMTGGKGYPKPSLPA